MLLAMSALFLGLPRLSKPAHSSFKHSTRMRYFGQSNHFLASSAALGATRARALAPRCNRISSFTTSVLTSSPALDSKEDEDATEEFFFLPDPEDSDDADADDNFINGG